VSFKFVYKKDQSHHIKLLSHISRTIKVEVDAEKPKHRGFEEKKIKREVSDDSYTSTFMNDSFGGVTVKEENVVADVQVDQVSISSSFHEQILRAQIPKVPKRQ